MRPIPGRIREFAAILLLLALGCSGGEADGARLHSAQREYWRALRFQQRLDIYPDHSIAELSLQRYLDIVALYPPTDLPDSLSAPEREGPRVRLARVGAMSALAAAGLRRELGDHRGAIELLAGACRPDLPLGALVERRLRLTLCSHLVEEGEPAAGLEVLYGLLRPIAPNLEEGQAAYPDAELLALPAYLLATAAAAGPGPRAEAVAEADRFFDAVIENYAGGDAEYEALLGVADLALATERWERGEGALQALAERFPGRDSWRSDLRRARLLIEVLGREAEGEEILRGLFGSGKAAGPAGIAMCRHLLRSGRLEEAEAELTRLHRRMGSGDPRSELLYLWGELELRRDSWERAGDRWREAAAAQPFSAFGMRARLAIATQWALRDEPTFSGRSLARLFAACRRNTRHYPGSAGARLSLELESRGDSLLGTLPASVSIVRQLQEQRAPRRGGP